MTEYKERYKKVKLTMNRIKQVLSERARLEIIPMKAAMMKKVIDMM